jgi:hypothetical protein
MNLSVGSRQHPVSSCQLPVASKQSVVGSRQSAVGSLQSAVTSRQSAVGSLQHPVSSCQLPVASKQSAVGSLQSAVGSLRSKAKKANRGSARIWLLVIVLLLAAFQAASGAERDGRWAILLAGVSGDPGLQTMYLKEIRDLHSLLVGPLGFQSDHVVVLFDDPGMDPGLVQHKSTRKGLEEACLSIAARADEDDLVFVFIEGHGSYDGKIYKLNLVGPDPTDGELAEILYSIPAERFVVVNATNCSGGSLRALSRKGKIVITATKSGMEKNQTHMGEYFIDAFRENAADSDKNGRVSISEAFFYTSQKVEEYYAGQDNLQTEHSVLDDNGDAQGQSVLTPESGEGLLSRTTFLDSGIREDSLEILTPEQQKLALEAREVELEIEALKYDKEEMAEAEYEQKLEALLLRLARINAKLHP